MPLFDYTCPNLHRFEMLIQTEEVPDVLDCVCGEPATRGTVYRQAVVGPVWSNLEHFDSALLTPNDRQNGARFKSGREIERFEQERGLCRQDPNGAVWRGLMEEKQDEARDIDKVRESEGASAAIEFTNRQEILDVTGWDRATYSHWKEQTNAAERAVAADPSLATLGRGAESNAP
jgi:hypothetical protein